MTRTGFPIRAARPARRRTTVCTTLASRATAAGSAPRPWRESRVQLALALLGGLSMLPPYVGPPLGLELDVPASVEVVDHVLPGVVVALCGGLGALLVRRRSRAHEGVGGLVLYSGAFLAGLFQTATHAGLLLEAGERLTPWGAVLLHSTLAPVITMIALWLTVRSLAAAAPAPPG